MQLSYSLHVEHCHSKWWFQMYDRRCRSQNSQLCHLLRSQMESDVSEIDIMDAWTTVWTAAMKILLMTGWGHWYREGRSWALMETRPSNFIPNSRVSTPITVQDFIWAEVKLLTPHWTASKIEELSWYVLINPQPARYIHCKGVKTTLINLIKTFSSPSFNRENVLGALENHPHPHKSNEFLSEWTGGMIVSFSQNMKLTADVSREMNRISKVNYLWQKRLGNM